jgi:hypothetical protein
MPATVLFYTLNDIPSDVVNEYWRRLHPDLDLRNAAIARPHADERRDLNERGWRLLTCGYVQ